MELKNFLTNEKLSNKFNSQFDLVNYAIKLAANMIQTGREGRVNVDSQSRAIQVLGEILNNKDYFDNLPDDLDDEGDDYESFVFSESVKHAASDKKKVRKPSGVVQE